MTDKDTIIASQEAEILRLQQGFDDLKHKVQEHMKLDKFDAYDSGWHNAMRFMHNEICKITGEFND